jgi:hypothetical protein
VDKDRITYFGIIFSTIVVGAIMVLALANTDMVKNGWDKFIHGSSKEDPFCWSWAECPGDTILVANTEPIEEDNGDDLQMPIMPETISDVDVVPGTLDRRSQDAAMGDGEDNTQPISPTAAAPKPVIHVPPIQYP